MPLSDVETGRMVCIVAVNGGYGLQGRLAALGLVPGARVQVIANSASGPFIISVKGSRLVLGQGVARKIMAR